MLVDRKINFKALKCSLRETHNLVSENTNRVFLNHGQSIMKTHKILVLFNFLKVEKETKMTLSLSIGNEIESTSAQMIF